MNIKIAIPDNIIYRQLFFNAESVCAEFGITLIKAPEREVARLFESNSVDVAFLTPIDYGKGIRISDYRIIPANIFAIEGYSRVASTFFRPGQNTIKSCGSPTPDDFIMSIGKILMAERYSLAIDLQKTVSDKKEDILEEFDSAMLWKKNFVDDTALDITEDWYDTYSMPLVMGAWVVRHEEEPEGIERILTLFESDALQGSKPVIDKILDASEPRMGKLLYKWNDDIEKSFDALLEILYYHQFTDEIASVKLMGAELTTPEKDTILFAQDEEEDENQ